MNEEQQIKYEKGKDLRMIASARMSGAMEVWAKLPDQHVSPFVKARMKELLADYEQGTALMEEAMAPAAKPSEA